MKSVDTADSPVMKRLLQALKTHGPLSPKDWSKHSGVCIDTISNGLYTRILKDMKLIHIARREPPRGRGGRWIPIYAHGPGNSISPLRKPRTAEEFLSQWVFNERLGKRYSSEEFA